MQACQDLHRTLARGAPGLNDRAFQRAHAFIVLHLGEHFTLAELAAASCISRFHFARLFRARTGCSPMAYVMRMRLERAKEMLAHGDRCIAATAAELGFFDQSHFTRTFRRATGISPRAFSRQCRHGATSGAARLHGEPHPSHAPACP
ncbi:helix-turn-helix transcriptional regulator [Pseudoxanthomonas suwonensis]|uniref:HTH araC/xylS-type domain-containing protein n=1 Tax=Pseudoxanthomonas suwonensis TaxID=314722 RepID=A0A0E3ULV4_9GAMM|nr:helix-turn-helix transcriptional regulator [Pseudoxanthomonas suwonensis]AKC85806.1 hypothetical protein WQ53_02545 [Pseudoxanthomonas suwonensis]